MMVKNEHLIDFLKILNQEVINKAAIDEEEDFRENVFTQIIIDSLCDTGELEDGNVSYYENKNKGVKVNGFSFNEDETILTLFVCIYKNSQDVYSVPPSDALAMLKRAKSFYQKSTGDFHKTIEEAYPAFDLSQSIYHFRDKISEVKVLLFTNGTVRVTELSEVEEGGVLFSYAIWDLERLFREVTSGEEREKIEIDLYELTGKTLKCVKIDLPHTTIIKEDGTFIEGDGYTSYFTVFPGDVLFKIYEIYSSRLLERNVRAFLQARGSKSVNGGIKSTLLKTPEMFLAYNNGISATAESVEIIDESEDSITIAKIRDFQIVNGGQTTASIYNAFKKDQTLLKNVYVQAKITVVHDSKQMEHIVPIISKCANTQNKVQMADFSANDEFHIKIEELSRTVWAPAKTGGEQQTKWFYERARGQYSDTRSREKNTKYFDSIYPKNQYFDKLELARYENVWDQIPYITSRGGQASFRDFTIRLKKRGRFIPDQQYYNNLIAKGILYRQTRSIVRSQNFLGFWANVVDYTIAYISFKTAQRTNLGKIWKEQAISPALGRSVEIVSNAVYNYIVDSANGQNATQWCKKEACWLGLKDQTIPLDPQLESELIPLGRKVSTAVTQNIQSATSDETLLIKDISMVPYKVWYNISKWAKETSNLQSYQRSIAYTLGQQAYKGKLPSPKQAKQGLIILYSAVQVGYIIPSELNMIFDRHSELLADN